MVYYFNKEDKTREIAGTLKLLRDRECTVAGEAPVECLGAVRAGETVDADDAGIAATMKRRRNGRKSGLLPS